MGGRLCTQIVDLAVTGGLKVQSDKERIVLFAMASVGRDQPKGKVMSGVYYAGWEPLAKVLGYDEYTPAAERAVARAIAGLVAAGLIEPLGKAGPGRRQAYRITLPDVFGDKAQG